MRFWRCKKHVEDSAGEIMYTLGDIKMTNNDVEWDEEHWEEFSLEVLNPDDSHVEPIIHVKLK